MSNTSEGQLSEFHARLNRIDSGESHLAEGLIDKRTIDAVRNRNMKQKRPAETRVKPSFIRQCVDLVVTVFFGLLAILIGRVAFFHLSTLSSENFAIVGQTLETLGPSLGPWCVSAIFLFFVIVGLGKSDESHASGIVIGALVMFLGEAFIANQAQGAWERMYSVEYVDEMLVQARLRDAPLPSIEDSIPGDTNKLP
ncbi:MAG: hypothetical protein ABJ327_10360 [Litoreibacter sp.]